MGFERIWHKSYTKEVPPVIEPERTTMAEALRRTAGRFPDRTAFIYLGRKISFRELETLVNRFTRALAALGVRAGDKVAMLLPNIPQHVIANHACYRLGAIAVMNDPLCSERELETQLNESDARLLITLDLLMPRALKIQAATKIKTIIPCHINDYLPFPTRQLIPFLHQGLHMKIVPRPGIHPFLDIIGKESADPVPITARWQETAAIVYTGGTSGTAKGVMLTHAAVCAAVQQFRAWFPDLQDGGESVLGIYPIFHAAGYTLSQNLTIWAGWTSIMIPRPEPAVILDMLKKYRPSLFPGMPAIYIELLDRTVFRKMNLSFIKGFFSATAPLPADTAKRLQGLTGKRVHDIYGLTENTAFAACTPWNGDARPGTVGLPLPNTDIRIVDLATGTTELPAGEAGEICIKGPQLMTGYHKKPEETAAALRDGWLYTGDIGFLDGEGRLSVVDRKQEVIVTGGYSVYPREIDEILSGHPQIIEACAIGIPDASAAETIKAFVVVKPGDSLTEAEIIAYCKERLATHKMPKQIAFLGALPRNTVGKILLQELRAPEKKQTEG